MKHRVQTRIKFIKFSALLHQISENIKINENTIADYVTARTSDIGIPTFYAVKIQVPIISGILRTINITGRQ